MAKVYVLQTGQTTWEQQSRLESAAGSPLTEEGETTIRSAARELLGHSISTVYAYTTGEPERQTAELVATTLRVKMRERKTLHELDYGLWQGLTVEEIKRRQPRAYRQWSKTPASIRPPEGETLDEAQERLKAALKEITKRHKNGAALLVLRPILTGLLRCLTEDQAVGNLWQRVDRSYRWGCYEVDDKTI